MATPAATRAPTTDGVELVCWKVWGGNRRAVAPISIPGLRGVLHARPHESDAGGDLYFLSACGSGAIARLCVADMTGHGSAVAKFSASLERTFGSQIHRENPSAVLREVNRRTVTDNLDLVSTGVCLSYNSLNGTLGLSNAGHPHILHCESAHDRWTPIVIDAPNDGGLWNIPLGIDIRARYKVAKRTLKPGDKLLVMTDGLNDAQSPQGEAFGKVLCNLPVRSGRPEDVATDILNALEDHAGSDSNPDDDITFVVLEVQPYQRTNRYALLVRNNWPRLRNWLRGN